MVTLITLDLEFTGLHQQTTPVSLGMVADDGRMFYMEFRDYDADQVTPWLDENVLVNLIGGPFLVGTLFPAPTILPYVVLGAYREEAAGHITQWLEPYDEVQVVGDVPAYDWVLFCQFFGGALNLPQKISPAIRDLNQDIAQHYQISEAQAFDRSRAEMAGLHSGGEHNALLDAAVQMRCLDYLRRLEAEKNPHIIGAEEGTTWTYPAANTTWCACGAEWGNAECGGDCG